MLIISTPNLPLEILPTPSPHPHPNFMSSSQSPPNPNLCCPNGHRYKDHPWEHRPLSWGEKISLPMSAAFNCQSSSAGDGAPSLLPIHSCSNSLILFNVSTSVQWPCYNPKTLLHSSPLQPLWLLQSLCPFSSNVC